MPLQPLPVIKEPFRCVAVDHFRYVLTLKDFATRYPEAILLQTTDAAIVAEALRSGVHFFMSDLMRQVTDILGIDHIIMDIALSPPDKWNVS